MKTPLYKKLLTIILCFNLIFLQFYPLFISASTVYAQDDDGGRDSGGGDEGGDSGGGDDGGNSGGGDEGGGDTESYESFGDYSDSVDNAQTESAE